MSIKAEDLANELNLDLDENTTKTLTNLIDQAAEIVKSSVNSKVKIEDFESDQIYIRAVFTLATQLYYDRILSEGMSIGLRMMINHLVAEYAGVQYG